MARKRSKNKNKKIKMSSKRLLDNSAKQETDLWKKIKLEHKLILVTISNKHPGIDIDDHEIQNFLLVFNLLIEAESDKISNSEDAEVGIPDILITIAAKLLQPLHNNIDSLKLSDIIKSILKKLKSFIIKDKKDGTSENDSENSSRPVAAAKKPGPFNQRRRRQPRQRIRGRSFKIKRLLAQQRNINVKKMV